MAEESEPVSLQGELLSPLTSCFSRVLNIYIFVLVRLCGCGLSGSSICSCMHIYRDDFMCMSVYYIHYCTVSGCLFLGSSVCLSAVFSYSCQIPFLPPPWYWLGAHSPYCSERLDPTSFRV